MFILCQLVLYFPFSFFQNSGHDVHGDDDAGDARHVQEVHERAARDLRGRRVQADAARPAAVLREAGREGEEPQAAGPAGLAGVQPGSKNFCVSFAKFA